MVGSRPEEEEETESLHRKYTMVHREESSPMRVEQLYRRGKMSYGYVEEGSDPRPSGAPERRGGEDRSTESPGDVVDPVPGVSPGEIPQQDATSPDDCPIFASLTDPVLALHGLDRVIRSFIPLHRGKTYIGRNEGNIIFPNDPHMSPWHTRILWDDSGIYIKDMDSLNGVFLEVPGRIGLTDGDSFFVGSQLFRYRDHWRLKEDSTVPFGSAGFSSPHRLENIRHGGEVAAVHMLAYQTTVGREGDISYDSDPYMSVRDVMIVLEQDGAWLEVLESKRGVFIRTDQESVLELGLMFIIGSQMICLKLSR